MGALSPFGIAVSTTNLRLGTGVTCPTIRLHPAIVAQAAATSAAMLPGRFFLGVGTGENLNEHILGDRWPSSDERREMLDEAIEVMRGLWEGELYSFDGTYYTVDNARIYTLPEEEIEVAVAAGRRKATELAGEAGDALISTAPDSELVDAYVNAGGRGPRYGQLTVCWAQSESEARRTAFEWWPNGGLRGPLSQELPLPRHFEAAVQMVTEDDVADSVVCGPDADAQLEGIEAFAQAGTRAHDTLEARCQGPCVSPPPPSGETVFAWLYLKLSSSSSTGISGSDSSFALPRAPRATETRATVTSSGASTMLTKSYSPSAAHWWSTFAPISSTSRFTSRRRSGFACSVCTPFSVSVVSIRYVGISLLSWCFAARA
jgi:G6PDH family F420-dependent oxidoreductase